MPNLPFISAKVVVARVIRALGYKLPSMYHDDILEWIPEGMGMLQVTNSLVKTSTGNIDCPGEIVTKNHCAKLPCGLITVLTVEDKNGRKLPKGGDITDIKNPTSQVHAGFSDSTNPRPSVFNVNPFTHQTNDGLPAGEPGTNIPIYGEDLTPQDTTSKAAGYYQLQGNFIQTSFETGYVKIHYLALPVDEEGYPLIPDSENLKQALEWHVIKRLIGAGFEHKVFTYDYADKQYETYAGRARNEISYMSLDDAEKLNRSFVRLIPPHRFAEDFFVNSEQPERLHK